MEGQRVLTYEPPVTLCTVFPHVNTHTHTPHTHTHITHRNRDRERKREQPVAADANDITHGIVEEGVLVSECFVLSCAARREICSNRTHRERHTYTYIERQRQTDRQTERTVGREAGGGGRDETEKQREIDTFGIEKENNSLLLLQNAVAT